MTEMRSRNLDLHAEAADRIVRAQLSGIAPDDDASLVAWRRSDCDHEAAFLEAMGTWEAAEGLENHPGYAALLGQPTLRERWIAWRDGVGERLAAAFRPQRLALVSVGIVVLAVGGVMLTRGETEPSYQTQTAEVREVQLDDGSRVTLGARSALDVAFEPSLRRVKLASGEAFFSVAANKERPFIVEAGDTRIRVVGTKFNVNYESGRVRVSVLEGVVEVMRADGSIEQIRMGGSTGSVRLVAGQQAVDAPSLAQPKIEPARISYPGAWREGRLSYQDAPLAEIIADANRYRDKEIRLVSPALGRERLTTSFKASQIDQMLEQLPDTLPVRVSRNPDGTVDLRPL